jgi:hypothetical protein
LANSLLNFWGIALNPAEDGARVNGDTGLLHHLGQIMVADPVFAIPAYTQQDDLDWKAAALEQRQQDGSSTNRPLIIQLELMQQSPESHLNPN